jgi:hypothetical protein
MTDKNPNRHLSGSKGGQFAEKHYSEAANVTLAGPPAVSPDFLAWRLEHHGYAEHLNPEHVEDISGRLNESLDLSDKNIAATANEVYTASSGHSLDDAVAATAGLARLREEGQGGAADAIERMIDSSVRSRAADEEDADSMVFTVPETGRKIRVEKAKPLPDGKTVPVPADDPRLQAGEVFDKVESDWGTFHRRREGVFPNTPYAMRLQANRPLSENEKKQMAGLVGYAYRTTVAGESLGDPDSDSPYSFMVSADMTKSRRDDLGIALEEFEEKLPEMIQEGSPVRKTNQAGPGTAGTRLVEGFNDPGLKFEVYYDEVIGAEK